MDNEMDNRLIDKLLRRNRRKQVSRAQGLVEFAIILPVLLMLVFVLIELARVLHAWMAVENGARVGIRYAVTAEYNPDNCSVAGGFDVYGRCNRPADESPARVESIHEAAWAGSSSIVRVGMGEANPDETSYFNVLVCDPENLVVPGGTFDTHLCPDGEDPGGPGEQVIVVVEFNHPVLLPLLNTVWPQLRLTARREATVETYRIPPAVGTPPVFNSPTPRPTNTGAPPKPPVELCKEWEDLHFHRPWKTETYFGGQLHEHHGWDTDTVAVNRVVITDITVVQDGRILEIRHLWVGNPGDTYTIPVGEQAASVNVPVNLELRLLCSGDCYAFRESLVEVKFEGVMDGEYTAFVNVFFPEYNKTCTRDISVDTDDPTPPPPDTPTPGPSPTDMPPPPPTNTPYLVTSTPGGPGATAPPD